MNRIKELREKRNLNGNELAEKIKTSQSTISKLENGEMDLKSKYLIVLADFFGVTTDYLLGISNDPSPANKNRYQELSISDKQLTIDEILHQFENKTMSIIYNKNEIVIFDPTNPLFQKKYIKVR